MCRSCLWMPGIVCMLPLKKTMGMTLTFDLLRHPANPYFTSVPLLESHHCCVKRELNVSQSLWVFKGFSLSACSRAVGKTSFSCYQQWDSTRMAASGGLVGSVKVKEKECPKAKAMPSDTVPGGETWMNQPEGAVRRRLNTVLWHLWVTLDKRAWQQ